VCSSYHGDVILRRLREETRSQHEALEEAPATYRAVLVRFRGFYATWEAEAQAHASEALLPVLAGRTKLPMLDADLLALGLDPQNAPRMERTHLPDFAADDATLLGSMYVVEGATLGGQLISRQLERSGEFHDGRGYSFFQSYGQAVGQQWKVFTALLQAAPNADGDAIVASAQHTFGAFSQWFAAAGFTSPEVLPCSAGNHPPPAR
jgi:heme oxygenase